MEELLEKGADPLAVDSPNEETPLHLASRAGLPMSCYQVCSKAPAAALRANAQGQTPVDLALASERGEVLNAMLLACAGSGSAEALAAMRRLLAAGAVCDTWAPNGSSALMLAAGADSSEGCALLLKHTATLELQDALGRTALMFAAGTQAAAALVTLLDAGASVAVRDRRGKNVMDYAPAGSEVRRILEERLAEMESRAAKLQEALLAELCGEEHQPRKGGGAAGKAASKLTKKKGKAAKKKAAKQQPQQPAAAEVHEDASQQDATLDDAATPAQPAEQAAEAEGEAAAGKATAEPAAAQAERADDAPGAAERSAADPAAGAPAGAAEAAAEPAEAAAEADIVAERAAEAGDIRTSCPGSPEWTVVGPKARPQHARGGSGAGAAAVHAHSDAGAPGRMRRNPSSSSLASTCSWESQDTDLSRQSGSERSVLRHPSRCGSARPAAATAVQHQQQLQAREPAPLKCAAVPPAATRLQAPLQPAWTGAAPALLGRAFSPVRAAGSSTASAASSNLGSKPPSKPASQPASPPACASPNPGAPAPAVADADAAELAALRAEVVSLRQQLALAELRHQQELAPVLEEATWQQAQAVEAERQAGLLRFTAFLQRDGVALLSILPDLLASSTPLPPAAALGLLGGGAAQQAAFASLGFPPALGSAAKPVPATASLGFAAAAGVQLSSSPPNLDSLRGEYSGPGAFLVPAAAESCSNAGQLPSGAPVALGASY